MPTPTTELSPAEIVRVIGDTSERAIAYVRAPDPRLTRLPRKVRENVITDIPPVTAGALLGTAALARHFVASAASGRYRDLFSLWELFRSEPEVCKPVLAERREALAKAREALNTAVRLGVRGRADLLALDIERAEGLIWQWLREALLSDVSVLGARPMLASALLKREPDVDLALPEEPDDRWLAEAATASQRGPLAPPVEALLGAHVDRLPATVATLSLTRDRFPDKLPALVDHIDLDSADIGALLAWARDHGQLKRLHDRIRRHVAAVAERDVEEGLSSWWTWRGRGVDVEAPAELRRASIDAFDLTRPETAALASILIADGAQIDAQQRLNALAERNRQLAEKAYEAFVCEGHDVHLPDTLRDNQIVKEGTRCPWCEAWTWVRPGHEQRCPRAASGERIAPPPSAEPVDEWTVGVDVDPVPPDAAAGS